MNQGRQIWGFDQQPFIGSGNTVTLTNANKPASVAEIFIILINGLGYASTGGDITYSYDSPTVTFSEDMTGMFILVDYRYLITTI